MGILKKSFQNFAIVLFVTLSLGRLSFASFFDLTPEDIYAEFPEDFYRTDHAEIESFLNKHHQTPDQFINQLNSQGYDLLCVGETHRARHRQVLSDYIFAQLKSDHLLIEAQYDKVSELVIQSSLLPENTSFLGAPISDLFQQVFTTNPEITIKGVEHTPGQKLRITQENIALQSYRLSRDGFIAKNIVDSWQQDQRHVALYGASHCSHINEGLGFGQPFFRMLRNSRWGQNKRLDNIKIVFLEEAPKIAAFLQRYSLGTEPMVLTHLNELDPKSYNYEAHIMRLFMTYNNLLVIPAGHP